MKVEDFARFAFIVGAPRCGTTTISALLQQHPSVSFSAVKEPHFFSLHDLRGLDDQQLRAVVEEEYLERFFGQGGAVGADGSVSYLYTPEQLPPILSLWPDSRFIIAVRDPMAMLPSLHERLIYLGDETLQDFTDAWAAVGDRAAGRSIPRTCVDPRWLRYDEAGRLGTYVERLFKAVGRERCLVVVFDDLAADPKRECARVINFLGLEPIGPLDVPVERAGLAVRYPWLQRLLKRPPTPLRRYFAGKHFRHRLEKDPRAGNSHNGGIETVLSLRKRLLRWNRMRAPRQPLPISVQHQIRAELRDEIDHLGSLIGRDLSHWLQPSDPPSSTPSPS